MIYITGDTHSKPEQLSSKNFPAGKNLTKSDYVIIAGDFGLLWYDPPDKEEIWWKRWLEEKPFTTLFIDGNHENFTRLNNLPEVEMFGNRVGKYGDSIYHLKRGNVYIIDGVKVFTFGGAISIDRQLRIPYKSWWPEELPTYTEMNHGVKQLEQHNNEVDLIITHDIPLSVFKQIFNVMLYENIDSDPLKRYFDFILENITFNKWFVGHYHEEMDLGSIILTYEEVTKYET